MPDYFELKDEKNLLLCCLKFWWNKKWLQAGNKMKWKAWKHHSQSLLWIHLKVSGIDLLIHFIHFQYLGENGTPAISLWCYCGCTHLYLIHSKCGACNYHQSYSTKTANVKAIFQQYLNSKNPHKITKGRVITLLSNKQYWLAIASNFTNQSVLFQIC